MKNFSILYYNYYEVDKGNDNWDTYYTLSSTPDNDKAVDIIKYEGDPNIIKEYVKLKWDQGKAMDKMDIKEVDRLTNSLADPKFNNIKKEMIRPKNFSQLRHRIDKINSKIKNFGLLSDRNNSIKSSVPFDKKDYTKTVNMLLKLVNNNFNLRVGFLDRDSMGATGSDLRDFMNYPKSTGRYNKIASSVSDLLDKAVRLDEIPYYIQVDCKDNDFDRKFALDWYNQISKELKPNDKEVFIEPRSYSNTHVYGICFNPIYLINNIDKINSLL